MGYGAFGLMVILHPERFHLAAIPDKELLRASHRVNSELRTMFHNKGSSRGIGYREKRRHHIGKKLF